MKNLKRVLALVLVVTLVFSLSVSALAFTDDAAITHEQAVNVLSELGVIKGYPDGSYRPNDPVTRAEMAKMITVILNKGVDDPSQFESGVTDLTDVSWNWGKSYITYCYLLNIIAGYGDGTFRPEDNVTVQEAAKMILVALGFDVTQEGLEGVNWAVNANSRANQYDIYVGVTQGVSEAATRDTIAQMLYNMLKTNTVHYEVNIYTGISTMLKDEIALSKYFNCELLNGMIVANEYASLWDGVPLMSGRTEILYFEDDAVENGIFDIAKGNFRNDELISWVSDTLNVSTGQDELGLWVTVIRNQTTKKIVGDVMLNNELMTVVEGGDGNFLDAIKAAGLRLTDGRYTVVVNGQVFDWESAYATKSSYYFPAYANHPLASYNEAEASVVANQRSNAYLGTILSTVFGTEFKDMNGMTFRAVELNGDNYVDVIYVEAETLTQVTKIETKGGAKEYTFAGLNLAINSGSPDPSVITNYTAQSVKAADIVTDATLAVDDYVLVTQVNETYYVEKVEFEDLTVSVKNSTDKKLTLKDKDDASTTYNLSNIPIVHYITDDTEIFTNDKNAAATLLNTVVGNKYTFGFDSAGNVVMAKEGEQKTEYALLNGMATTYGTSYTTQLLLEDGVTVTGGVGKFKLNYNAVSGIATDVHYGTTADGAYDPNSRETPSEFLAGNTGNPASSYPLLVAYKQDGTKYDITGTVDVGYTSNGTALSADGTPNVFSGNTNITIEGQNFTVTSNTVFYYRIQNGNKVDYYAYTDYTKAPTFTANNTVEVQAATVTGKNPLATTATNSASPNRLAAVYVSAQYGQVDDVSGQDYIYVTRRDNTDYTNKQTTVTGIIISKDGKVTETAKEFVFDDAYEASDVESKLFTYTSTSTEGVYKRGNEQTTHYVTLTDVKNNTIEYSGLGGVSTYSSTATNTYYPDGGGVKYEKQSGNFSKNLNIGDTVAVVNVDKSTNAAFIMRRTASTTTSTTTFQATSSSNYLIYNNDGTLIPMTVNSSLEATGSAGTLSAEVLAAIATLNSNVGPANNEFTFVTVSYGNYVVTTAGTDGYVVGDIVSTGYQAAKTSGAPTLQKIQLADARANATAAATTTAGDYYLAAGVLTYSDGTSGSTTLNPVASTPAPAGAILNLSGPAVTPVSSMTLAEDNSTSNQFTSGAFWYVAGAFGGYTYAIIVK